MRFEIAWSDGEPTVHKVNGEAVDFATFNRLHEDFMRRRQRLASSIENQMLQARANLRMREIECELKPQVLDAPDAAQEAE